jgi:hypothetical protein
MNGVLKARQDLRTYGKFPVAASAALLIGLAVIILSWTRRQRPLRNG